LYPAVYNLSIVENYKRKNDIITRTLEDNDNDNDNNDTATETDEDSKFGYDHSDGSSTIKFNDKEFVVSDNPDEWNWWVWAIIVFVGMILLCCLCKCLC